MTSFLSPVCLLGFDICLSNTPLPPQTRCCDVLAVTCLFAWYVTCSLIMPDLLPLCLLLVYTPAGGAWSIPLYWFHGFTQHPLLMDLVGLQSKARVKAFHPSCWAVCILTCSVRNKGSAEALRRCFVSRCMCGEMYKGGLSVEVMRMASLLRVATFVVFCSCQCKAVRSQAHSQCCLLKLVLILQCCVLAGVV